jgi:cytoskeletal protein CcmA (bactofilin family)
VFSKKNQTNKKQVNKVSVLKSGQRISDKAPSIIVSDLNILGDLISEGAIEIGGCVRGNIKCKNVVIRKGASIEGDIYSDFLVVHGKTKGVVKAKNLHISANGFVCGKIEYYNLTVDAGAEIDGVCKKLGYDNVSIDEDVDIPGEVEPEVRSQ